MQRSHLKLGELLLYAGKIDNEQYEIAIEKQKTSRKKLGEILVDNGWVTASDIVEALEYQLGFPRVDLSKFDINDNVVTIIPETIARKYKVIAIDKKDNKLVVAMVDPLNFFASDDIKLYTKMELQPVVATNVDITRLIDKYYSGESTKKLLEEFNEISSPFESDDLEDSEMLEVTSAPIVIFRSVKLMKRVRSRASDIHIEPSQDDIRVRFRIDGDLREIMTLARNNLSPIVTRIKIIGKMNIAEKRLPQDGRIEGIINDKEVDMRISSLPTVYGEKIVIRLLDKSNFNFSKETLGFMA